MGLPANPEATLDRIRSQVQQLSREPYRDVLADMISAAPDIQSLREFSKKSPDRWAQAVSILGKLSGYNENKTITHEHNFLIKIQEMSDAELEVEYENLKMQLLEHEKEGAEEVLTVADTERQAQDAGSIPARSTIKES